MTYIYYADVEIIIVRIVVLQAKMNKINRIDVS